MTIKSADKKPEKYIGPDGKPKIRMVPVDREVVKSEAANASKEAQRHMQGMKDARADMKVAKSADAMTKAMNKLQHHTKAHKKAMAAMEGYSPDLDPDVQKKKMITKSDKAKLAKLSDLMKKANEAKDPEEYDKEGDMAKTQLKTMINAAQELHDQLSDDENMPEWVQNKITKATDYIDSVRDYMKNNDDVNEAIDMSKVGTKATIMHPTTRVSKKVDKKDLTKYIDKGWKHMGPKKQRVTWGTKKEETQLDEYGGPPISRDKYLKQKPMKERELTPTELKKREKYAQDLPDDEFKKRYGDKWKAVKIATATKMAKGEK